jgi:predicted dehydrogenase
MAEIHVAVIGFGLAGRVFHAPFVNAVPGLKLDAIVQRRGDDAQKAYPAARTLRSVQEALDDSTISLVVVGTPNETHYDLARQALLAGKHVVIDKPFAATSAEARELIQIAAERNLVLAPFHNRRWDGDFKTARRIIASGELGRLATFESHFDRFRPLPREGTWKEAGNDANGMLFDLGPHLDDQVLALFGAPEAITASVRRDRDTTEIEDAFDITLHYPRLLASCRATMLAAEPAPRFLLHGTHGSFRKYGLDPQEPALVAGSTVPPVGDTREWLSEPEEWWGTLAIAPNPSDPGTLQRTKVQTEPGDYRGFYESVRDAILGKTPLAVSAEDGYRVIRLLELARVSSTQNKTLSVGFN